MIAPLPFALLATLFLVGGLALAALRPALVVDHPRGILLVLAIVTLGAAAALVRLDPPGFTIDIDPASEPLLRRHDPARDVYARATASFGNDDVYVIAMETDDVFTRDNLETLQRLTGRLRQLPGIAAVESLTWVLAVRYDAERDLVGVARFMNDVP